MRKSLQFKAGEQLAMEQKSTATNIEVKASGEDGILHIKFYALAFNNVDSWGDIIMPSALDEFLKSDEADRMALCWQHNLSTVIGRITDKGVDDQGMWVEADVLPTTVGKDAAILLKGGAIKEFSIGYRAERYHYEKRDGYSYDIRVLDQISVFECSPVTIAANPKAVLTDAKHEDPNHTPKTKSTMTPEEIKAMRESIEKAAREGAAAAAELKVYQDQLAQAKAQHEEVVKSLKTAEESINNLDATVKAQDEEIKSLKDQLKAKVMENYKTAVTSAIAGRKDDIKALKKGERLIIEFKLGTTDLTVQSFGAQQLPGVSSDPWLPNAFLANIARDPQSGAFITWLEGSSAAAADYIDELGTSPAKTFTVEEKSRKYAKIGAKMTFSSEIDNWYEQVLSWARNEAARDIEAKADEEIYGGAGADASAVTKKKVYGLKGESTAFSGKGKYDDPTIADVINDAKLQARKNGFVANQVYVSYEGENALRTVKDKNGNYIYNEVTGMLGQLKVIPSVRVAENEILVLDSTCVKVYDPGVYEFEIERDASIDGYHAYVRKHIQKVTKTAEKKGIIYVADWTAVLTSITKPQA